jgi:cytochrome P450 family 114
MTRRGLEPAVADDAARDAADLNVMARLLEPDLRRDPYPYLAWLREHAPVHRATNRMFILSRHADVLRVLQESGTVFLSPDRRSLAEQFPESLRHRSMRIFASSLALSNPPEHTRLRRFVTRAFTARRVEGLQGRIGQVCDGLLDGVAERLHGGESVDLQSTLSEPLTIAVLSELLGIPEPDRQWLSELVAGVLSAYPGAPASIMEPADKHTEEMEHYLGGLIAERRRAPRDDLISAFAAPADGSAERLADDELVPMLWALWCAGFKTSAGGISAGILAMLGHPEHRELLRAGPREAGAFVDEALRRDPPTILTPFVRIATRDVEFDGGTVPAGSDVRLLIGAANRDPAVFPDPDRFDPSRDTRASLTFTAGIHFCAGAVLARTQVAMVLPRLVARFPGLVAAGEPEFGSIVFHHMATRLPVALA